MIKLFPAGFLKSLSFVLRPSVLSALYKNKPEAYLVVGALRVLFLVSRNNYSYEQALREVANQMRTDYPKLFPHSSSMLKAQLVSKLSEARVLMGRYIK